MDIRSLITQDDSEDEESRPSTSQQQPIRTNASSSDIVSPPLYSRDFGPHGQDNLSDSLLNSSRPFSSQNMEYVSHATTEQELQAYRENPEAAEGARILLMMKYDRFGAGANGEQRAGNSSQESDSDQSTIARSSRSPPHPNSGLEPMNSRNLDQSPSLYRSTGLHFQAHGYPVNSQPASASASALSSSNHPSKRQRRLGDSHSQGYQARGQARQFPGQKHPQPDLVNGNGDEGRYKPVQYDGAATAVDEGAGNQEAQQYVFNLRPCTPPFRRSTRLFEKGLIRSGEANSPASAPAPADRKRQNPPVAERPKAKSRVELDAGQQQFEQGVNAAIGYKKPPGEDATKEEYDRYFHLAIAHLHQRDKDKHGKWKELEKSEEYLRQMRQQTFQLRNHNDDDDEDIPEFKKFTDPPVVRGKGKRKAAPPKEKGCQERLQNMADAFEKQETEGEAQTQTQAQAETASTAAAPVDGDQKEKTQNQDGPPPKKRRGLTEELQSELGVGWDVHVDDEGHRPGRGARKPPK